MPPKQNLTCNHKRHTGRVTVCALIQAHKWMNAWMGGWMFEIDGLLFLAGWRSVLSVLSCPLCFLKGGNGETEAQTQTSLSALRRRGMVEKGCTKGQIGFSDAELAMSHASASHRTLRSSVMDTVQEGATELCASTFTSEGKTNLLLMMLRNSLITNYLGVTDVPGT